MKLPLKKSLSILISLAITLSLASCGNTPDDSSSSAAPASTLSDLDEEAFEETAAEILNQVLAGEFAQIEASYNTTLAAQLPAGALHTAWEQIAPTLGDFQQILSADTLSQNGYTSVTLLCQFTLRGLNASFSFDREGKLAGIGFTYAALTQPDESGDGFHETSITIGEGDLSLNGKLTLPAESDGKVPVVILIQGSGSTDMDETIGAGNKPFRDLAHGLAKQGIATIRYDKRYYAHPEYAASLSPEKMTIEDEVLDDLSLAIAFAQQDERLDSARIYMLGHSLGGMLAPKAAQDHPELRGIISMAGSPRTLEEILYDQNIAALEAAGKPAGSEETIAQLRNQVEKISRLDGSDLTTTYFGMPAAYWVSLHDANGGKIAPSLTLPFLILQGDADFQVYPDKDYAAWQELLAGKDNVTFRLYAGLNHLMMPTNGRTDATEYNIPAHVDQQVIDDIAAWITEN